MTKSDSPNTPALEWGRGMGRLGVGWALKGSEQVARFARGESRMRVILGRLFCDGQVQQSMSILADNACRLTQVLDPAGSACH